MNVEKTVDIYSVIENTLNDYMIQIGTLLSSKYPNITFEEIEKALHLYILEINNATKM